MLSEAYTNIFLGAFLIYKGGLSIHCPLCAVQYTTGCCVNCVCVNLNKQKNVLFLFAHCAVSITGKPSRALHALYLAKLQYLDSRQHLVRSVLAETSLQTHFNRDPICKSQICFILYFNSSFLYNIELSVKTKTKYSQNHYLMNFI